VSPCGKRHIQFAELRKQMVRARLLAVLACAAQAIGIASASTVVVGTSQDSATLDTSTPGLCHHPTLVEKFTRRRLYQAGSGEEAPYYLITQQFVIGENGCYEGYRPASVSVDARRIDVKTGKLERGPVWSFSTDGIDGGFDRDSHGLLYRIDMPGCCESQDTSKYFSLSSGRLVVSTTVPLLIVKRLEKKSGPDQRQYIGVESNLASSPQAPPGAMSTLFLGDTNGIVETISIASAEPSNSEGWSVETLELQPTPIHPRDLAIDPADKPLLHVVLSCHCDAPSVDLLLPITRTGIEITDELQRAAGVKLTKNGPKGSR
jgi:hypothetical protein